MKFQIKDVELPEYVGAKAGDFVYRCRGYDYGCASDDTAVSGIEHISVTLDKFGNYPSFTIPLEALDPNVEQDVPIYPDDVHVSAFCKPGTTECCRYLTMGARGWSCEKHTPMAVTLDFKAEHGTMNATGDNCEGLYSR